MESERDIPYGTFLLTPLSNERSEIKLASWNIHGALSDPDRALRLADVASGEVFAMFESLKLRDADPDGRPTMPSKLPLFQLDHLLMNPDLAVTKFNLDFHPDLSDHGKLTSTVVLS